MNSKDELDKKLKRMMSKAEHTKLHAAKEIPQKIRDKISKTLTEHEVSNETKQKISHTKKGSSYSDIGCENMSKSRNTTGFYCVSTKPTSTIQGFSWLYQYYENGKQRSITSVNLEMLKEKVIQKNLKWLIINERLAIETCKKYNYDFKDLM